MKHTLRRNHTLAVATVLCNGLLVGTLHAQLVMSLSGTPGSSVVRATFSGSSTATSPFAAGVQGIGWEFLPDSFDPFPAEITGSDYGIFPFTSGSASITINGVSQTMDAVFLQDSSNSPRVGFERFGTTGFNYGITVGDTFEWSGTATFDIAARALTFDNLRSGSSGPILGDVGGITGALIVVPEPSSPCLLFVFAAVAAILRRGVLARTKSARPEHPRSGL